MTEPEKEMRTDSYADCSFYVKFPLDVLITIGLWSYFTIGFVVFFAPFYVAAYLLAQDRAIAFQRLNHQFYIGFFALVRFLTPSHTWDIQPGIARLRSSIIVCNHISYLDPLILIALFEKHKTIVKRSFFKVPIFGWMLKTSGYLASGSGNRDALATLTHIETLSDYLASGGNLFVFPEGTRSRDGTIARLNKGAFKIARLCQAPIQVLHIQNTNVLFRPGHFLFNTTAKNTITIKKLKTLQPDYTSEMVSVSGLMKDVRMIFETENG